MRQSSPVHGNSEQIENQEQQKQQLQETQKICATVDRSMN